MLPYVVLFLIILGLFLGSLVRSRMRTRAGKGNTPHRGRGSDNPVEERGEKGE